MPLSLRLRFGSTCHYTTDTVRRLNTRLNALAHANAAPETPGPADSSLGGWTVAVKSNIATAAAPTSCASQSLENYRSPFTATAVAALEQAGARVIGTTNMDEFGMGSKNQFGIYGPALNPHGSDADRSPGGSSGGSAAAVAAGMCRLALGSDTGGSVRLPAAWCGVVGFKPSYGRVSRCGLVAYGSSLDAVGFLARTAVDVQTAYRVAATSDPRDMTCMSQSLRARIDKLVNSRPWLATTKPAGDMPLRGVRIGVPREFWVDELSVPALAAWKQGAARLAAAGCEIVNVSLPHIPHTLPAYYTLALAEASSNLARYDGIRFGTRASGLPSEAASLANASLKYANTRTHGLGSEVRRRILLGTYVMSAHACRHYYLPSQRIRRLIQREFNAVFALPHALCESSTVVEERLGVDALLFPTATDTAPLQHEADACPVSSYVNDVMTVPANLAGIPAISVPAACHDGLPLGLQLAAQYGDDELLLQIASVLETVDR
ncbi:Trimeric GatFAB AmidoTransferase(AdT) complex subunit [Coemansia sp. RSA 2711]|nr:Trimeric GatFAB AmidoTransferase(AdT) complex subunit [Coemansia sp. RSA 2711]